MKTLVTGTSGFVGGAIGRYLRSRGHDVTGLSRRPSRIGATDRDIRHDLTQPRVTEAQYDTVIHAAALSAPWGRAEAFDAANITATRNALAMAERFGAHFILISSSSVLYSPGDQLALPEADAPETPPVNDYARTKRAAERLTAQYSGTWSILRPRAVYGVGDTVLFPRIARAARLRLLPRFQQDIPAVGDLVSIDNLVRQVSRAVETQATGIFHLIDPGAVHIGNFVADVLHRLGLPGPSIPIKAHSALKFAGALETVSRRTGWWEPPLTRYGVDVFTTTKTFDDSRTRAILGPPDIPTDLAVTRFQRWWRDGARLDGTALGGVGDDP